MRKYKGKGELESVWCNWCGKRLIVKDGILREGSAHFELTWDYFRKKTEKSTALISANRVMTS